MISSREGNGFVGLKATHPLISVLVDL